MLRRVLIMAAAQNSRGRAPRADSWSTVKGGRGRHQASSVQAKPPTGRGAYGSQSHKSLVSGLNNLSLRDSGKSSASSVTGNGSRRPYTASRRPVSIKSVEDIATLLREELVRNVVIVAGAGISTPSGIPDFRSPGTGLYDNLQQYSIPYAEAIFDIDFFQHNPRPFFTLAKELFPCGKYRPNYLHYFARLLHDRGLLLRVYTQNIDGLERIAGIPADKMVEAHGTFSTATCITCRLKYDGEEIKERIFDDKLPRCKRTTCNGVIKPDIVFFGEELPKRFYYYLKDMLHADLVIIMGTSLEVQPFAGIIDTARFTVPRVLFNRMAVGPFRKQKRPKDFVAAGDLIEQVQQFVDMVGWSQDIVDLITSREGYFKTAFPPPVPPPSQAGDKKAPAPARADPLARMWRQNAQVNFYSDSDSSDTDSGVTPSDSDSSSSDSERGGVVRGSDGGVGGRVKGGGGGGGDKGAGKSSSSSTVSSSSSGCVSNASSRSAGPGAADRGDGSRTDRSGPLLTRRNNQGSRSFSQHAVSGKSGRKDGPLPVFRNGAEGRRAAWTGRDKDNAKDSPKPPPVPPGHKKPPLAAGRGVHQSRQGFLAQRGPAPPGTHAVKPRSNSVTKAVPEKRRSKALESVKALYPRVTSAQPGRLAYRHSPPVVPYDARMLAINTAGSDSSSSDDQFHDDDTSDDSSDDS